MFRVVAHRGRDGVATGIVTFRDIFCNYIYMGIASRDSNMDRIKSQASHYSRAIAEGFANLKQLARNNPYLREVLEEHRKGVRETIVGLEAQKDALG